MGGVVNSTLVWELAGRFIVVVIIAPDVGRSISRSSFLTASFSKKTLECADTRNLWFLTLQTPPPQTLK